MFLAVKLSDFVCIMLINVKMSIIVGILTFMSMINFMRVDRVLGNAESGVFLRQLLVLYAHFFLLGILIYANSFSADASQTP